MRCNHCRNWCDVFHHRRKCAVTAPAGAGAQITAGTDDMYSSTGAGAAITAGTDATFSFTGADETGTASTGAMYPPARAGVMCSITSACDVITPGADVKHFTTGVGASPCWSRYDELCRLAHALGSPPERVPCTPLLELVLRSLQELVRKTPSLAQVAPNAHCTNWYDPSTTDVSVVIQEELMQRTPPLEHVMRVLQELVRCTPPLAQASLPSLELRWWCTTPLTLALHTHLAPAPRSYQAFCEVPRRWRWCDP